MATQTKKSKGLNAASPINKKTIEKKTKAQMIDEISLSIKKSMSKKYLKDFLK